MHIHAERFEKYIYIYLFIFSFVQVCRKLQGADACTANWTTNVGNERGEIVQSVLTVSEGLESLQPMADGLIGRYRRGGVPQPKLIYTDRDCCCKHGPSKLQVCIINISSL